MTNKEKAQQLIQEYGQKTDFCNYTDAVEYAAKEMGLTDKVILSMILMELWSSE